MTELFSVFLHVVLPVFGIVALGALLGERLALQPQTLTRTAYYVFVPAFIFQMISQIQIPIDSTIRMLGYILLTHLLTVIAAGGIGRLLGHSKQMIAAYMMIASFGNVGNYGLALLRFHLGKSATEPATIYFVAITIMAFVVCVGVAGWANRGSRGAVWGLLKTPALWATVPAVIVASENLALPLMLTRMIGLLADAMIPVMLFALGLQLREQKRIMLTSDVWLATGIRLVIAPLLAVLVAMPFGLSQTEYTAGVLQSAMPVAVLVAIISKENDIVPTFVTSTVVISTLVSLLTLTLLMVIL